MKPLLSCFFLWIAIFPIPGYSQDELVPVTSLHSARKPPKGERLQIRPAADSIQVWGFNLYSLLKRVKKINTPEPREKINLVSMRMYATQSMDKTYRLLKDTSYEYKSKPPAKESYDRLKAKFLGRKKTSAYFKNQWVMLGALPGSADDNFTFITRGFLRKRAAYQFDFLPGAGAGKLPAVDPWNCVPAEERFFKLRKLQGYGLDKLIYKPYISAKRQIIRKQFEVYFPVNSTEPDAVQLQEAIDFLQRNHVEILSATMEGGCSVEGDSLKNYELQVKRAHVLSKALRQYNNSTIKKDTVLFSDTWTQFRELLKYSDFKGLDSLSNQTLRNKINRDQSLRNRLEPLLATQRKASLALVMAKVFTYDERLIKLETALRNGTWWVKLNPKLIEAEIMGMLDFLFQQYEEGAANEAVVHEILDNTGHGHYLHALLGYHFMKKFEEMEKRGSPRWREYWNKNHLGTWFLKCQNDLIFLASSTSDMPTLNKYRRMLADYQAYTFKFIQMGLMETNFLCELQYPNYPAFINLQLYRYAFLYELASQGKQVSCAEAIGESKPHPKDTATNTDAFIEKAVKELGITSSTKLNADGKRVRKPGFDNSPKSVYYQILKEKFVLGHDYITNSVEYVNETAPVELDAFNLTHLVMPNVDNWDPERRYFYDKQIQLEELDKLITKLKKIGSHICPPQINQVFLDYHVKALYYLDKYVEPGNERQTKIAEASIRFIDEYYKSRTKEIKPALSLHILKQLNLFNWLPGTQAGAWYGYDLLKVIAKQRLLNDEELKLYAHYIRLYDPTFKNALPVFYEKEQIIKLGREKYGLVDLKISQH